MKASADHLRHAPFAHQRDAAAVAWVMGHLPLDDRVEFGDPVVKTRRVADESDRDKRRGGEGKGDKGKRGLKRAIGASGGSRAGGVSR